MEIKFTFKKNITSKKSNTSFRSKKELRQIILLVSVVMLMLLIVITGFASTYYVLHQKQEAKKQKKVLPRYEVPKPDIEEELLSITTNSRPAVAVEQINGVVIHYTANPGTDAKANRDYFENRKNMPDQIQYKVSSHFIIGLDGKIIQCIPLDEIAYASNDRNQDTISIECCHPDKIGKFNTETRQSLVRLTAWLCGTYNISQEQVIRHYDVTGKMCPRYYVKHPKKWKKLKQDIFDEMKKYPKK